MATKAGGTGRFKQDEKRRDSDHVSFLKHRGFRWLWIALALSAASIAGYLLIDQEPRPNGGTWYGYTLGTIGVGLILWLSLLGVRKRRINPGAWSLKAWTSAHVYLGLSLIVIGTLHTGFQIGWNVHTLAYVLMLLVIATGIYGVVVYATLPASLSANRKEMTRAQMLDALTAIDRQLESAAQPLGRAEADLVIGAVLTIALPAAAVAYLSLRLARYGAQIVKEAVGFVQSVLAILTKFMQSVDRYKAVAVRGVVGGVKQGTLQMRWRARQNAVLKQKEPVDDVPAVSTNPKGDAAASSDKTVTNGCPVSMVTGEELLTLTDGTLDGILPFEWTRLYRTSAVEVDGGLGFGWSHSLAHRLAVSGDSVVWTDHENRMTSFPMPQSQVMAMVAT